MPTGSRPADDVVVEDRVDLLVSDRALSLLQGFAIGDAFTTPADEPPFESELMTRFVAQQHAKGNDIRWQPTRQEDE